ncbi:MAG: MaoC/PaaZ C-terminal domain-containing protein [Geminicoccaceae bacterium]
MSRTTSPAVSGDANPTHFDEAFARGAQLDGIVAHSALSWPG